MTVAHTRSPRIPILDPSRTRQVMLAIHAWQTKLFDDEEYTLEGSIMPLGELVMIEPLSAVLVLLWIKFNREAMALSRSGMRCI